MSSLGVARNVVVKSLTNNIRCFTCNYNTITNRAIQQFIVSRDNNWLERTVGHTGEQGQCGVLKMRSAK
jgi:hypothetical protein